MTPVAAAVNHHFNKKFLLACLLAGLAAFLGQISGAALAILVLGEEYAIPLSMTLGLIAVIGALALLKPSGLVVPILGERFSSKKLIGWGAVTLSMIGVQTIYALMAEPGGESAMVKEAVDFQQNSLLMKIGIVASIAVFAPITEEIIFRHLITEAFAVNTGRHWVWIGSALSVVLFTIGHTQYLKLSSFIFVGAYAIILTLARLHTGGIFVPILMHVMNNSFGLYEMATYTPD